MEAFWEFMKSASGAAVVVGIFEIFKWFRERKEPNCKARGQEIQSLQTKVDNLTVALRIDLYDKIKGKAKAYIKRGYITVEEYEDLKAMHRVYHDELGGNGFLDSLMKDVDHLEKLVL